MYNILSSSRYSSKDKSFAMRMHKYICFVVVAWTLLTTNCYITEAIATYSCTHNELQVEIERWKKCSDVSIQTSFGEILNLIDWLDGIRPITSTRLSPFCHKPFLYIPFFRDQIKCSKNLSQKCFEKNISNFFSDILLIFSNKCDNGCNCRANLIEIASFLGNLEVGPTDFMYLDGYVIMYPILQLDKGCDFGKMIKSMKKDFFEKRQSLKCTFLKIPQSLKDEFIKHMPYLLINGNQTKHIEICKYWEEVHASCYNQGDCKTQREIDLWLRVTFSILDFYFKVVNQLSQSMCHRSYLQPYFYNHFPIDTLGSVAASLKSLPMLSFCHFIDQLRNSFKSDSCPEISKNISEDAINKLLQRKGSTEFVPSKSEISQEISKNISEDAINKFLQRKGSEEFFSSKSEISQETPKNISEETANDGLQRNVNVDLFSSTTPHFYSLVLVISAICFFTAAIVAYGMFKSCYIEI